MCIALKNSDILLKSKDYNEKKNGVEIFFTQKLLVSPHSIKKPQLTHWIKMPFWNRKTEIIFSC